MLRARARGRTISRMEVSSGVVGLLVLEWVKSDPGTVQTNGASESGGKSWRKQNRPEFIACSAEGDNDFAIRQTAGGPGAVHFPEITEQPHAK